MEWMPWAFGVSMLVYSVVSAMIVRKDAKESVQSVGAQFQSFREHSREQWEQSQAEQVQLRAQILEQNRMIAAMRIAGGRPRASQEPARFHVKPQPANGEERRLTMAEDNLDRD